MLADIVSFTASDGLVLYGALYEPRAKSSSALLYVSGLGGSFYGSTSEALAKASLKEGIALFSMQHRGSYIIESFNYSVGRKELIAGSAMERFEDSEKDIRGAITFLKSRGYRRIILVGKSTGCQKSVYYLSRNYDRCVKGLILLSPVDDRNFDLRNYRSKKTFDSRVALAKRIAKRNPNALMPPEKMSSDQGIISASRFLSTSDSSRPEGNIFDYKSEKLSELSKVKVPTLAVFGSDDEYMVIPPAEAAKMLERNSSSKLSYFIVEGAGHSLFKANRFPSGRLIRWSLSVLGRSPSSRR